MIENSQNIIYNIIMLPVVAPEFGSKPKNASAPMKGEAKFEVDFDGEPKPDVKW